MIDTTLTSHETQAQEIITTYNAPFKLVGNQIRHLGNTSELYHNVTKLQDIAFNTRDEKGNKIQLEDVMFGKAFQQAIAEKDSLELPELLMDSLNNAEEMIEKYKLPWKIEEVTDPNSANYSIGEQLVHTGKNGWLYQDAMDLVVLCNTEGLTFDDRAFEQTAYFSAITEDKAWHKKQILAGNITETGYKTKKPSLLSRLFGGLKNTSKSPIEGHFKANYNQNRSVSGIYYPIIPKIIDSISDTLATRKEFAKHGVVQTEPTHQKTKAILGAGLFASATAVTLTAGCIESNSHSDDEYVGEEFHIWKNADQQFLSGTTIRYDNELGKTIEQRNGVQEGDSVIVHGSINVLAFGNNRDYTGDGVNDSYTFTGFVTHQDNCEMGIYEFGKQDRNTSLWWQIKQTVRKVTNNDTHIIIDIPSIHANDDERPDLWQYVKIIPEDNKTKPVEL